MAKKSSVEKNNHRKALVKRYAAKRAALLATGIRVRAADVGGNFGRTLQVRVGSGTVTVRVVGGEPVEL